MVSSDWHVFVGSAIGLFKGVNAQKQAFANLNSLSGLNRENEITALCWEDTSESKVYIGQRNHTVKIYDCELNSFPTTFDFAAGNGSLQGLALCNDRILTAVESGIVKVWNKEQEQLAQINCGGKLSRMRQDAQNCFHIATGGEENDLKIWDLQKQTSIFQARNVRNDFLDLRVPVWVMDMQFRPDNKIVTCSRHHQIRLYDPKAQRRPVIDMEFEKHPLMSLSLAQKDSQLIVGSSRGRMALIDLRWKGIVHAFKGFAGSIRCVQCHPCLPLVASCGLDRFLRIHELNEHRLLKKIYLKTQLNCLLMKSSIPLLCEKVEKDPLPKSIKAVDEDEDKIWSSMSVVKEKSAKTKSLDIDEERSVKKQKVILQISK